MMLDLFSTAKILCNMHSRVNKIVLRIENFQTTEAIRIRKAGGLMPLPTNDFHIEGFLVFKYSKLPTKMPKKFPNLRNLPTALING